MTTNKKIMKVNKTSTQAFQLGRTLIELLVSLALGMLILLGVGTLYLGANQSARVTQSLSAIEESGQVVMSIIGAAVRRAGYSEIIGTSEIARSNLLFRGPHLRGCPNGYFFKTPSVAVPTSTDLDCVTTTAGGKKGDSIQIAFQADNVLAPSQGPTLDCLGAAPPTRPAPPVFAGRVTGGVVPVVQNIYYLTENNVLMCLGNGGPTPEPLLQDVEDFRVFYGFDDAAFKAGGTIGTGNSLLSAADLNAMTPIGDLSPWDFVVSIHICALVRTAQQGVTTNTSGSASAYTPCPTTPAEATGVPAAKPQPTDGRIRRAYTQVFTVRSRAAQSPTT